MNARITWWCDWTSLLWLYRLKRRWRDGTSHVIFAPLELVEKLAALVPPHRFNLVRYRGVHKTRFQEPIFRYNRASWRVGQAGG